MTSSEQTFEQTSEQPPEQVSGQVFEQVSEQVPDFDLLPASKERIRFRPSYLLYGALVGILLLVSLKYNPFYLRGGVEGLEGVNGLGSFGGIGGVGVDSVGGIGGIGGLASLAEVFSIASEAAAAVTIILLILRARLVPSVEQALSRPLILSASCCLLFGLAGFGAAYFISPTLPLALICGLALGFGKAVLFIAWIYLYSRLSVREIYLHAGLALCFSVIFTAGSTFLPLYWVIPLMIAGALMGVAKPILHVLKPTSQGIEPNATNREQELPDARRLRPLLGFALTSPILGVAVFSFCNGLTFDIASPEVNALTLSMPLVAFAILAPFIFLSPKGALRRIGFSVVLPLLAVLMLILVSLPATVNKGLLLSLIHPLLFTVVSILTWCFTAFMVSVSSFRPLLCASLLQAFQALPALLGYLLSFLPLDLRATLSLVLSSLLFIYLIWAFTTRILRHPRPDKTSPPSDDSCATIALHFRLSTRESEILSYLGKGYSSIYIARELFISENTVRSHIKSIYRKTGVENRQDLLDLINKKG
jgi:DNA-binding CsgD family transcriptional regulator